MIDRKRDVISELIQRLAELPDADAPEIRGATDQEIAELEAESGARFPDVYRAFLRRMGQSAGVLLRGSDCLLSQRHRLRLRNPAERIIRSTGSTWRLPADAFVFLLHQGYQFLYFRIGEGDDPPIYRFSDADDAPRKIADTLAEFLEEELELHERIVRECVVNESKST